MRPQNPHPEKLELYECGEPAVGTGFVQFDLRFYVVALLFIIFDVEVAFFFPWATVFGKATQLSSLRATDQTDPVVVQGDGGLRLTNQADAMYRELGVLQGTVPRDVPPSLAGRVSATAAEAERAADIVEQGAQAVGSRDDRGYCRVLCRVVGGLCLRLESR